MPPGDAARAIDMMMRRVRDAAPKAVHEGALLVQTNARRHASGPHSPTKLGVRTGRLRSSIRARPPVLIDTDTWQAKTYPTVIYARIQELGGHVYPGQFARSIGSSAGRAGEPGKRWLSWIGPDGKRVFSRHVYLPPRPYLEPGRRDSIAPYYELFKRRMADALGV